MWSQVGLRKHHYAQSWWRWWNSRWAIWNPERWCCESAALNMPANLENSAVDTGLEKVSFHSNLKARQCQRMLNYCTTALISHASKVILKILYQASTVREPWTSRYSNWIQKRQRNQRSNCQHPLDHGKSKRVPKKHLLLLYWLCQSLDCVEHNELWKILIEMEIPDHLVCLLRNLYAGQEAIVRTGHGTTDWFQIGKGVH